MLSLSKKALSARLSKKTLTLKEKIKVLDYKKKNPDISCRQISEIYSIGKTSAASIIKNEVKLRKEFESFQGNIKRNRIGKYQLINLSLYEWYKNAAVPCFTLMEACSKKRH